MIIQYQSKRILSITGTMLMCLMLKADPLDVEFKGLYQSGEVLRFSLKEGSTGGSVWSEVGRPVFGGFIESYDEASNSITFVKNGTPHVIKLSSQLESFFELSKNIGGQDSSSGEAAVPLIPYSSLSEIEQEIFYKPEFIETLDNSGIEVPYELRLQAESAKILDEIQSAGSGVVETTLKTKPRGLPLFNNSLTAAQKSEREQSRSQR